MINLSVIVVSYNSEDFIEKCVSTILKFLPKNGELIVLDNVSTDRTVNVLRRFSGIKLIASEQNLGFSKGNNRAVKRASGEYLFFLNPDTFLEKDVFTPIMDFYASTEKMGIIGPKLKTNDGSTQASVKKMPSVFGAFAEFILGVKNAYSQYVPQTEAPLEVECLYGAAMLISKEVFNIVGGFDERYFLYYEDVELCRQVRKMGYKVYYYPQVKVNHLVGASKSEQNRYKLNLASARIYHGFLGILVLQAIFFIGRVLKKFK